MKLTATENPRQDGLPGGYSQGEQTLVSTHELVALAYPDCISRISSVPGSYLHVVAPRCRGHGPEMGLDLVEVHYLCPKGLNLSTGSF
jgi:hypothetical protein